MSIPMTKPAFDEWLAENQETGWKKPEIVPIICRKQGWRGSKGPQVPNVSGLRAVGHRVLIRMDTVEEVTSGGIVLASKTLDKERMAQVVATVVEIGYDAWADKSTDYCDVGDKVLVGQYSGKEEVSKKDGFTYRFISDLDVISPID